MDRILVAGRVVFLCYNKSIVFLFALMSLNVKLSTLFEMHMSLLGRILANLSFLIECFFAFTKENYERKKHLLIEGEIQMRDMKYTYLLSIRDEFFIVKTNATPKEFDEITTETNIVDSDELCPAVVANIANVKGFEITVNHGDGYFHINGDNA